MAWIRDNQIGHRDYFRINRDQDLRHGAGGAKIKKRRLIQYGKEQIKEGRGFYSY